VTICFSPNLNQPWLLVCACVLLLFFVLCDISVLFLACCTNVSCSLFLFSTNLGSDRSCQQQQQHHTADEKTTAWRRYCYYRCLPAAGIAHTLVLSKIYLFFSLLCLLFFNTHWLNDFWEAKKWKRFRKKSKKTKKEREENWSNHNERGRIALWCLLIWLLCFDSSLLLVVWSVLCIQQNLLLLLLHFLCFSFSFQHSNIHTHIHSDRFIFLMTKTRKN